jgi:hypothetical protein
MSKKSRSRRKKGSQSRRSGGGDAKPRDNGSNPFRDHETQGSDTITLIWVLCVAASLMALVSSFGFLLIIRLVPRAWSPSFQMLPHLILVIGSVAGILGLVLTWIVRRIRQVPAPTSMIWLATLFCSLPSMIWIWTSIRSAAN